MKANQKNWAKFQFYGIVDNISRMVTNKMLTPDDMPRDVQKIVDADLMRALFLLSKVEKTLRAQRKSKLDDRELTFAAYEYLYNRELRYPKQKAQILARAAEIESKMENGE